MASGGNRIGSGRPRKADVHRGAVAKAEKQIRDKLPEILEAHMALALGVKVEDEDGTYQKPPDRAAGEYLINRIMGKPTERVENDIAGALRIKVEYDDPIEPS